MKVLMIFHLGGCGDLGDALHFTMTKELCENLSVKNCFIVQGVRCEVPEEVLHCIIE